MSHIRYRSENVAHDFMYDIERNVYMSTVAYIAPDGELTVESHDLSCRVYLHSLVSRAIQQYRDDREELGEDLFRAAMEISFSTGETIAEYTMLRALTERNKMLERRNKNGK